MKYIKYILLFATVLFFVVSVASVLSSSFNSTTISQPAVIPTDTSSIVSRKEITTAPHPTEKTTNEINLDSLVWIAKKYIGTPYKMGGMGFSGMDCSGLVKTVFKEMGHTLPHNSSELAKTGILIRKISEIKKGDLLFFHTEWEQESLINHTGIYIGNGYFIHATTSLGTIISKISDPIYKHDFICATRILLSQPTNCVAKNSKHIIIK